MTDPIRDAGGDEALRQVHEAAKTYLSTLADRPVYDPASAPLLAELWHPQVPVRLPERVGVARPRGTRSEHPVEPAADSGGHAAGTGGDGGDGAARSGAGAVDQPGASGLPRQGVGAAAAMERLLRIGTATATHSAGPRFFHFVIGGATPAALAADWTASVLDQNAAFSTSSRFAAETETIALAWLKELFDLPSSFGGALVASATFANLTGLAAATHWWAEQHGVDAANDGLTGLPRMPVLSGGYVHPSDRKALQLLGHGRNAVEVFARDDVGRVDLVGLENRLTLLKAPAVLIASAGEVGAGDFDPLAELADIAERHGAWLHVDAAFGLFAALSPRTAHLVRGIERADSIAGDGHKWLNVPYESGFAFLRDRARLGQAFGMPGAAYLPGEESALHGPADGGARTAAAVVGAGRPAELPAEGPGAVQDSGVRARTAQVSPGPDYAMLGPESSRRARSLPIWATLAAYGRDGYRAMVERHLDLARRLAGLVDAAPELERLAEVSLCIVCFRARPERVPVADLDEFNRRLGAALLADGRVYAGTTVYGGRVALRPAIVNWRTTEADIELLVDVVRELTGKLARRG